ncbi:MAG: efflux transporter outer membrane subunit [Desulfobulbus sp.]|uniref:efflux transporter outer membrane subunit n=1 Tax=Desulfobulbus sp. TaxID=895 RepID=UPI00284489BD|nr:efflux transporter outer membrane subunit [Desulfobulbus sp.]MDR2550305.1 efflux transporter outer membrane subunit [Desulfobulbus sp.]
MKRLSIDQAHPERGPAFVRKPGPERLWNRRGAALRVSGMAKIAQGALLLACVAALAGCTVGPDYVKPEVKLAPLHNAEAVASRPDAHGEVHLDQWWAGFQDPQLSRMVKRALRQNLDIQASLERVAQARAVAKGAGAKLLPALDADAQATYERMSLENPIGAIARTLPDFNRNFELYDAGLSASWETDLFGGLKRREEAALAMAGVAEAMHVGVRISIAAEVADTYFRIRGDQEQLRVAQARIATDTDLLAMLKEQQTHGMTTDREVAQGEALLAHAQGLVPLLRIDLEAQLNRLDVLLGAQPGTYAAELNTVVAVPPVPRITTQFSDFLRRRPDVMAAERKLAAANARIGAALAGYYPEMSLAGVLGYEGLTASHMFKSATFQPAAIIGLRWRLFDFGRIDAEVEQADAATREALLQYRQVVLRAAEDVENACAALVQYEAYSQDVTRQIDALKRVREDSQQAYKAGMIALTDVLDADRQLLVAEGELPRARTDAARASVRLFRSLGGGW